MTRFLGILTHFLAPLFGLAFIFHMPPSRARVFLLFFAHFLGLFINFFQNFLKFFKLGAILATLQVSLEAQKT